MPPWCTAPNCWNLPYPFPLISRSLRPAALTVLCAFGVVELLRVFYLIFLFAIIFVALLLSFLISGDRNVCFILIVHGQMVSFALVIISLTWSL